MTRRKRMAEYTKRIRDEARDAGLCTTCRKRPAEQGRCRCVECNAHRKDPRTVRRANYLSKKRKAARAAAKRTVEDRQQMERVA